LIVCRTSKQINFYLKTELHTKNNQYQKYRITTIYLPQQLWNIMAEVPVPEVTIPTNGQVRHIEVFNEHVLWSVDEPVFPDQPDMTVGTVHLLANPQTLQTIPIRRSAEMPYTHSFGDIRSFKVTMVNNIIFVITAGGEGLIRTWRYDPTQNQFEQVAVLEGHMRAVTCVLLQDTSLWSGSLDNTIRCWDVGSGSCFGVLSASGGGHGHSGAVTCMLLIPPLPTAQIPETYVASAGMDKQLKLWKTNGEFVHEIAHQNAIMAMSLFQDDKGGIPVVILGLADGWILARSCATMSLIFRVDASICRTETVWSIIDLGRSCFATAGDDKQLICWQVAGPLRETK